MESPLGYTLSCEAATTMPCLLNVDYESAFSRLLAAKRKHDPSPVTRSVHGELKRMRVSATGLLLVRGFRRSILSLTLVPPTSQQCQATLHPSYIRHSS